MNRQLEAFVDGELRDGARAQMEAHLDACERCRRDAQALRELGTALREREADARLTPEEAAAFEPAVRARIREVEAAAERHSPASLARALARALRGPILIPALAAFLGLVLGLGILRNGGVEEAAEAAEVERLEAGPTSTVMVIQEGRGKPPVIWIFEDGAGAD
jgi:anti-sigma factor RsiW